MIMILNPIVHKADCTDINKPSGLILIITLLILLTILYRQEKK